ncbi:MAG TPA: DUF3857 and transglutaminase domain-containing protein [Candidatus Acidoferrum sp.]|nr:DUF3857 and transglutaminase domain-containing protein [Candidatus Acidoferrum sp.]
MRLHVSFPVFSHALAVACVLTSLSVSPATAQQVPQKPVEKPSEKDSTPAEAQNPAQFELLETKYRFEANGDSRKEVHARVLINSELGVRQFARLNFDYNRSFQSVEIPLVHITHPTGGTADILPSAITDNPNPAVVNAPAYQDVRVKSVRILGLEPGDNLEYRVVTTTAHHPLAPDFWLDHSFDRTGVVTQELFEIDVPASSKVQLHVAREFPYEIVESENRADSRVLYRWKPGSQSHADTGVAAARAEPDVVLTTFKSWLEMSTSLGKLLIPPGRPSSGVAKRAAELIISAKTVKEKVENIYDFVSQKFSTIDIPLGSTGFRVRPADEILSSASATPEDKFNLFRSLCRSAGIWSMGSLGGAPKSTESQYARPTPFTRLLSVAGDLKHIFWLDPALEVAPFQVIPSNLRGVRMLSLNAPLEPQAIDVFLTTWIPGPEKSPYPAKQFVSVDATLTSDGKLTARVHYALRGDNELVLRVGFHQTPKEKWKDLAQLLSLSDGFRGQVTSVTASDPYATREPFTVDYEITQPKFMDWSKKPVRIPALLPQLGLPDSPAKPAAGAAIAPIELGTPLEVETKMTLHLPPDTDVAAPTGTSVQRDYATYASQYSIKGLNVSASRHINFLLRQVPAERAADYNAFLRAVLTDQAQDFTLESPASAPAKPDPSQASPKPKP